jgi:uncharacterized protein YjdB
VSAVLAAGGSGVAYLRISGPTLVGVGGTVTLVAAVGDAAGDAVPQPAVTWTTSDDEVLSVVGASDTATVTGLREGGAAVFAASGGLTGSIDIEVVGELAPVSSVTIVPSAWTAAVGDSLGFRAELRDAGGNLLSGRPLSWFSSDAAVAGIEAVFGEYAVVRARASGTATLRATSEGKAGEASITVP